MKRISTSTFLTILIALTSCTPQTPPKPDSVPTDIPQPNMPNPASAYCEEHGYRLEIRTAADGGQAGYCIFPDGSECDEWAYFRNECGPDGQASPPTEFPTAIPIDPAAYQGWWTYTHAVYNFTIMLPEDWVAEEITTFDPLLSGHTLNLYPTYGTESIRVAFRRVGEDVLLWPTGVGAGEFIEQGTLDVAGQPAQRLLLVCPTGEITSIWYHEAEGAPNITRGDLEFGFIYSMGNHCEPGLSLSGKLQHLGEMIIASLKMP